MEAAPPREICEGEGEGEGEIFEGGEGEGRERFVRERERERFVREGEGGKTVLYYVFLVLQIMCLLVGAIMKCSSNVITVLTCFGCCVFDAFPLSVTQRHKHHSVLIQTILAQYCSYFNCRVH